MGRGSYSRDPKERLEDSIANHYVGVRLQQGVPLLDADWNELEDLRRYELEDLGKQVIGDGTPVGSIGFRILPTDSGAIDNIVIESAVASAGISTIRIDLEVSDVADALGFDENNFFASRDDSSPAGLISNNVQPFALHDGGILVIQVNDRAPVPITFNTGDFADITAATAAEVVAVINATTSDVAASAGTGDFIITGGGGTPEAGRLLVAGQMLINEHDLKYSEQPLYNNANLAERWGVDVVSPLETPQTDEAYVVFVDVWNREVDSQEDRLLVDDRIGIETAVRLRREWAVRVVKERDYNVIYQSRPDGHAYYRLSLLQRQGGEPSIMADMITDLRETDLALRREIAYYGTRKIVLVDTKDFNELLTVTRNNVRDFIVHLTTKFVDPDANYVAAEVMGIDALSAIANVADQGIALLSAKSLSTQGALEFFVQLNKAEERFVTVWAEAVLPLNKPSGQIYERAFAGMIERINAYLAGPAPTGFSTIPDALTSGDLYQAGRAQQRINLEMGREISRPTGFLMVTYLGSLAPTIIRNETFDLRYELTGSVTPDDEIEVDVFIDPQWQTVLRNADGSIPFQLRMGPGEDEVEFIVSVTVPDVAAAETTISLHVYAQNNEAGLWRDSTQKTLTIGQPTPPSEEAFAISIISSPLTFVGGVYEFPPTVSVATFNVRFANNTAAPIDVDIAYEPEPPPTGWRIYAPEASPLERTINDRDHVEIGFDFMRPGAHGSTLDFRLRVTEHGTTNLVGECSISIKAVPGT